MEQKITPKVDHHHNVANTKQNLAPSPGRNGIFRIFTRRIASKVLRWWKNLPQAGSVRATQWRGVGYIAELLIFLCVFSIFYFGWGFRIEQEIVARSFFAFNRSSVVIMYSSVVGVLVQRLLRVRYIYRHSNQDVLVYGMTALGQCVTAAVLINCLLSLGSIIYPQLINVQTGDPVKLSAVSVMLGLFSDKLMVLLRSVYKRLFGHSSSREKPQRRSKANN